MSKGLKCVLYTLGLASYAAVMLSLHFNYYIILLIVPIIALFWSGLCLVRFIQDYNSFKNDIASDKNRNWEDGAEEYVAKVEKEPHDLEWKFETVGLYGFTGLYLFLLIGGILMR